MRAEQIASRGRVGFVTGVGLASSGRLCNIGEIVVTVIRTEIIRLMSALSRVVRLESEI